jgi:outer membrane protein OmpA-like peptidoglycan-associated protein
LLQKRKVRSPNKIKFASFGRFSENPWDFKIDEDKNFKRGFLQPMDSAIGIYWDPVEIAPDESIFIKTYYGIYGTSVRKGEGFSLSISSPSEIYDKNFLINADLQNINELDAEDVIVTLELPEGLNLVKSKKNTKKKKISKDLIVNIGNIESNDQSRASWKVKSTKTYFGKAAINVIVSGYIGDKKYSTSALRDIELKEKAQEIKKIEEIKETIIEQIKEKDENLKVTTTDEGVMVEFSDINFKFGSAVLTANAKKELYSIGNVLKGQNNFHLNIYGHTDNIGKPSYNYKLSTDRAKNVFRYMVVNKFINEFQGIYKGFGETKPVADNNTKNGQKKNRRVEIIIIPETEE